MNLHLYSNICNKHLLASNSNQKDLSATFAELNKEKELLFKILSNAEYYYDSTKATYFKTSLDIYQQSLDQLKKPKISEPELLLQTIKENHLTYLKESDGRILETIKVLKKQKQEMPRKFNYFFNKNIANYTKIHQDIKEIQTMSNSPQQETLINKTLLLLINTDHAVFNYSN